MPGFFIVPGVFGHTATLVVTSRWSGRFDTTVDVFYGSSLYGSFFATDAFTDHAKPEKMYADAGLDSVGIVRTVFAALGVGEQGTQAARA